MKTAFDLGDRRKAACGEVAYMHRVIDRWAGIKYVDVRVVHLVIAASFSLFVGDFTKWTSCVCVTGAYLD